ncbi:ferredoxin [Streptomyces sp. NPDC026659]|uniref:ferredoxin n=1 Tax=Streptomyces sp. NPDC026659 TaxID=3155123 RepID=UPI003403DB91
MTTPPPPRDAPYQFLEDRFACAQACAECARECAVRASLVGAYGSARRIGIMCAEVCDTTCHLLSEDGSVEVDGTETRIRLQLEWCRSVCIEGVHAFEGLTGAEVAAAACRRCAEACTAFMAALD